jgi:hypothetical protein
VRPFPSFPALVDADALSGHLWVQERVVGDPLRFTLTDDGALSFADRTRPLRDPPPVYRATVSHLRESFDRAALRAVADPAEVTFFGVATVRRWVDYDFDRLSPFVGHDVHTGDRFLGPAEVDRVFERLGVAPVAVLEQEIRADEVDPTGYDPPASAYRDGPPAGVVVRDKTGHVGVLDTSSEAERSRADPDIDPTRTADTDADPETVARKLLTPALLRRVTDRTGTEEFDAVFERAVDEAYRVGTPWLEGGVDRRAFRAAAANVVRDRFPGRD